MIPDIILNVSIAQMFVTHKKGMLLQIHKNMSQLLAPPIATRDMLSECNQSLWGGVNL